METGASLAAVYADENGLYQAFGVTHQNKGLRIRVDYGAVTAEATGAFGSSGETLTIDLRLALSVVKGTVFFHDGVTAVPYPGAFVTRTNADGITETFYNQIYDANGRYVAFGVPAGPFTVNAQDGASGLSRSSSGASRVRASACSSDSFGSRRPFSIIDSAEGTVPTASAVWARVSPFARRECRSR